jgi:hypothetical protein
VVLLVLLVLQTLAEAVAVAVATKLAEMVVQVWRFLSIGAQFNGTLCKNC